MENPLEVEPSSSTHTEQTKWKATAGESEKPTVLFYSHVVLAVAAC